MYAKFWNILCRNLSPTIQFYLGNFEIMAICNMA